VIEEENLLSLLFTDSQNPGQLYDCRTEVFDDHGNSLTLFFRFYGWNPDVPAMVINEFNPQGSGNNPDSVEILVLESGNLAGAELTIGTRSHNSGSFLFPNCPVTEGDFIILHCRPEGIEEEVNEVEFKDVSGGLLAHDDAWDFWFKEDSGISGSNGVLALYSHPLGPLLDAAAYSERNSQDYENYGGWTSSTRPMIDELILQGGWILTDGDIPPETAISSSRTTATRSLCRNSNSQDTNSGSDWHTVPTGGKSFGEINTDEEYTP